MAATNFSSMMRSTDAGLAPLHLAASRWVGEERR